jgi:hypothetical protein
MKSRIAVSLVFILIGATFTSEATAAFAKFRSWTGKVGGRYTAQVCNRHTPRRSAPIPPGGKTIAFSPADATKHMSSQEGHTQAVVSRLVGPDYHSEALDFVTTAARQIHEVLGLISIK